MTRQTCLYALAITGGLLVAAALVVFQPPASVRGELPEVIRLHSTVRDFKADHPDFDLSPGAGPGHCVANVTPDLPADRRPAYTGTGQSVVEQWYDKAGNPIMPYQPPADDPGLPGGHFDVDVFDAATDKERYHKHEFDDAYDVTYIDVANDPKLLYNAIMAGANRQLRLEFVNAHHGVGTFLFKAGGPCQSGAAQDGFTAEFNSASLTQLRVDFASLNDMRHTAPGAVQGDVADRDDAFAIRMYEVATGTLVYEIAVYHHGEAADIETGGDGGTFEGTDACGRPILDRIGTFDESCKGAVTSAETFGQWFRDVLGTNLSGRHTIELQRNVAGVYEYLSDQFYPIDGRLFGDGGQSHNNFFTMSFTATFVYDACAGQFFEFEGNDDAWVFIDDRLVIDLGGLATPERQYIALDRLDLEDGREYRLAFFYAHRRNAVTSVFNMRTNIELTTPIPSVSSSYD